MRRYHFNLYDGSMFIDDEGSEFASIDDARREALHFLGAALIDARERLFDDVGWRLEVTHGDAKVLFSVHLVARTEPGESRDYRTTLPIADAVPVRSHDACLATGGSSR